MALAPQRRCNRPGCRTIIRGASYCPEHQRPARPEKRKREDRGILGTYDWKLKSESYRNQHPLCVPCLFNDRITSTQLVDHIVPRACGGAEYDDANLCSMCWKCHNQKTAKEPTTAWYARSDRIVVCGLPCSGKSTYARTLGLPVWDADLECPHATAEQVQAARARWIAQHGNGPMVVIVSHPIAASITASQVHGSVVHLTTDETTRHHRLRERVA